MQDESILRWFGKSKSLRVQPIGNTIHPYVADLAASVRTSRSAQAALPLSSDQNNIRPSESLSPPIFEMEAPFNALTKRHAPSVPSAPGPVFVPRTCQWWPPVRVRYPCTHLESRNLSPRMTRFASRNRDLSPKNSERRQAMARLREAFNRDWPAKQGRPLNRDRSRTLWDGSRDGFERTPS
jgi:hypothetical protein